MKANCNEWLTFRDERHTLAHVYESLRRVTTTNESTRILTHLNVLSSFEYLIMFSSSSFHIKSRRRHIQFIRFSLVKMRPRYVASMTHQDVFQQQIIINQLIRVQLRWGKRSQSTSNLAKTKAASRETCQFGIYYQLKVELRKEDHRTFQNSSAIQMKCMITYSRRSVIVSGNNIHDTGSR